MKENNVGLLLSGGGTRGFAHLGVWKAIMEIGIKPDLIAGVSAGSIAGAFMADGQTPHQAFSLLTSKSLFDFVKMGFPRRGFARMDKFEKLLREELQAKNIQDLSLQLKIFATNLNSAELESFEKGDLVDAIIASSSIPVLFEPRNINGQLYLDGGLVNNFPAEVIRGSCKTLIGVNLNPLAYDNDFGSLRKVAERCFHIMVRTHAIRKMHLCDYYIEPQKLDKISILNTSLAKEVFDYGYTEAMKVLKKGGSE